MSAEPGGCDRHRIDGLAPLPSPGGTSGDHAVRVDHVLLRGALVELLVAAGSVVERDRGGVDRFGDLRLVAEDRFISWRL